jgi:hypothetical protein
MCSPGGDRAGIMKKDFEPISFHGCMRVLKLRRNGPSPSYSSGSNSATAFSDSIAASDRMPYSGSDVADPLDIATSAAAAFAELLLSVPVIITTVI